MALILLVEDDLLNREMICRYLEIQGFEVVTGVDGAQAVRLARTHTPDLILMDMGLPVLSGWQATERIKAEPATRAIPVVALTAYAMAEDRDQAFAVGCDDFETKPVNFVRLKAKIDTLLDAAARARTA
jgi:CheY-like chemotaxis protein